MTVMTRSHLRACMRMCMSSCCDVSRCVAARLATASLSSERAAALAAMPCCKEVAAAPDAGAAAADALVGAAVARCDMSTGRDRMRRCSSHSTRGSVWVRRRRWWWLERGRRLPRRAALCERWLDRMALVSGCLLVTAGEPRRVASALEAAAPPLASAPERSDPSCCCPPWPARIRRLCARMAFSDARPPCVVAPPWSAPAPAPAPAPTSAPSSSVLASLAAAAAPLVDTVDLSAVAPSAGSRLGVEAGPWLLSLSALSLSSSSSSPPPSPM